MRDLTVFPEHWLEYEPPGLCHGPLMSLFGGGAKAAAIPPPPPVVPMPDINDPALIMEQKRAAAGAASRSGRASTILSGGDYGDTTLGTR